MCFAVFLQIMVALLPITSLKRASSGNFAHVAQGVKEEDRDQRNSMSGEPGTKRRGE